MNQTDTDQTDTDQTVTPGAGDFRVEPSSGNVFADLGVPDADQHRTKADLAFRIRQIIGARGLTQTQAAALLGTSQARVSNLFRRRVDRMTLDLLIGYLNALDCDVEIAVRPRPAAPDAPADARGRTLVAA